MAPRKKQRYWIEDPSVSWTRSQVKKLPKKQRTEIAVAWFLRNYEDPANKTPYESREGGYQYIWGGPYDASDEIASEFGGTLTDADIEAAVEEVQSDGIYDWAPVSTVEDADIDDAGEYRASIGSHSERERRTEVLTLLDDLDSAIAGYVSEPPGIGHNKPPEATPIEIPLKIEIQQLHLHVHQLKQDFAATTPDGTQIEKNASLFKRTLNKVVSLAKKALEAKVAAGFGLAGTYIADKLGLLPLVLEKAQAAWAAIVNWLSLISLL